MALKDSAPCFPALCVLKESERAERTANLQNPAGPHIPSRVRGSRPEGQAQGWLAVAWSLPSRPRPDRVTPETRDPVSRRTGRGTVVPRPPPGPDGGSRPWVPFPPRTVQGLAVPGPRCGDPGGAAAGGVRGRPGSGSGGGAWGEAGRP